MSGATVYHSYVCILNQVSCSKYQASLSQMPIPGEPRSGEPGIRQIWDRQAWYFEQLTWFSIYHTLNIY